MEPEEINTPPAAPAEPTAPEAATAPTAPEAATAPTAPEAATSSALPTVLVHWREEGVEPKTGQVVAVNNDGSYAVEVDGVVIPLVGEDRADVSPYWTVA